MTTEVVGFPDTSADKESICSARNTGDRGLISGSGRCSGEGNGNRLQYSCLKNPMDRGVACYSPWSHKESDMTKQRSIEAAEQPLKKIS